MTMIVREALAILNLSDERRLQEALQAYGVPAYQRTSRGMMLPGGERAVLAIAAGGARTDAAPPAAHAPALPALPSPAGDIPGGWTPQAVARALEHLHAHNVGQDEAISCVQDYLEGQERLVGEMVAELTSLRDAVDVLMRSSQRAPWMPDFFGSLYRYINRVRIQTGRIGAAGEPRREFAPTFEAWAEESVGGRRH